MTKLQTVELGVLGPVQVRQYGLPVTIPGAKPRAILTMLGLHGGSVVSAETLVELLWGDDPPRTAAKALQTHISSLRRALGDGFVLTEGTGWALSTSEIDAIRYQSAARRGRDAIAGGDINQAVARIDEALALWRGVPELPDGQRGASEKTRWIEGHAALVEDRAEALLATGRAAELIGELEAAVADAPLRERRWGHLMLALYRSGRQGEALGAYQRARSLLAGELGIDPGPDLRRLEAAIVAQDDALEIPVSHHLSGVTRAVTFLLTDIEGSTAAWEADTDAMAVSLARHDEMVEQVVTSRGGRLVKTRGEGDATFSVFDRPSAAAAAAVELQEAIGHEPWALAEPMRIRVALHTGEVELREGDYFGRAVNRAARLRSLAAGGQILCSGATAELVIDTLPDDVLLADLGMRPLRNLARPEHVFELRLETADEVRSLATDAPMMRPGLPAALVGPGPFVGRGRELAQLLSAWQTTLDAGTHAVLVAGEPGVGKTRLAGEWSRQAYEQGAVVLYGRCDEDLGAPYQPFAEALRSLVPCLDASRLRKLRGVEALLPLVPGLTDVLPDVAAPTRADPDTERYALFDAVVALLQVASTSAPVVLVLDDLHWAAKPTLLLLRHLLRFGEHACVQIVGTYRSTDLDRSHPLAAMLADLHRDGSADRLALSGLEEDDVTAYVAEAGYDDEELGRALASVTGGNPFFLIEALRHVDESGGRWDPSTLPQGVREAVSRRLSRLPAETNKALAAAAVVGSRFSVELVERVVGDDLVDAFDEACKAGIVIEEPGGHYRFNHAIVRQSLLAELASVRRMRLHQRIAAELASEPGADDDLLAELAYHYFECAWAGNATKAVEYCRRAADQAMARLAYEGAADLYDKALHALDELDDELPDRNDLQAELLVARCEALLAAGDVTSATGAVSQLNSAAGDSARLTAWGTCFDGQLSMLTDPERLDEIESAVHEAAEKLAELDDAAGEAKAHTVRAACLGRLGRVGDCETALDQALTAARRAGEHRLVNAVLAGAPLAALWGPNPVPRAGGRCLDVVRLLRITTGSPVVEATSTRCQGVLDAFRGRAAAGRQLIDSARRSLTELGMRHALLEVDQSAGIVELVADDPAAAEPHLRRAYKGFRRMGLDADTAETAALLARACLTLARDAEADELCTESERLAGHDLKASIAWRTVRAQLLARSGAHDEARRVAEEAVAIAERTDGLVDHGDACLALATVLGVAGDAGGARAAAERAVELYELKDAAALAEKARSILGGEHPTAQAVPAPPTVDFDNACVRVVLRLQEAADREAWDEAEQLFAANVTCESRRKIVGYPRIGLSSGEYLHQMSHFLETGMVRYRYVPIAVRGERLALTRLEVGTADSSSGAPQDEMLQVVRLDDEGRIALQVCFDLEDINAAVAELDVAYARFENERPRTRLENAASRADARFNSLFADRCWDEIGASFADDIRMEDRRRGLRHESDDRAAAVATVRAIAGIGAKSMKSDVLAIRGNRLALVRVLHSGRDERPEAFRAELLRMSEVDADGQIVAYIAFDPNDFEAAIAELDARFLAGEAAAHAHSWSLIAPTSAGFNRHELVATTPNLVTVDHRLAAAFEPGDLEAYIRAGWDVDQGSTTYIEMVHRLTELGAVVTYAGHATSAEGFDAEWRVIDILTIDGDLFDRCELFDETDLDVAIAKFDELNRPAPKLENTASRVYERMQRCFSARDWDGTAEAMAVDIFRGDRRRVVNAEANRGRDAAVAEARVAAGIGAKLAALTVVAIRGARVALIRSRFSNGDPRPEAFNTESLCVIEIDRDERIAVHIMFDPDDLEAAIAELDERYLAGEAAAHAHTWSVIAESSAALNRHEMPATTTGFTDIDHRRAASIDSGDMEELLRTALSLTPVFSCYIETVHRLTDLGAVVTQVAHGTSQDGFDAEWRIIGLLTVEGDLISRCEVFDETDLDAALARFDELNRPAPQLESPLNQWAERFRRCFEAHDWPAIRELFAEDFILDDRRRAVNAGVRHGRDAEIDDLRAAADVGFTGVTMVGVATRGRSLALARIEWSGAQQGLKAFRSEWLGVAELDADERVAALVMLDLDDIDAAFAELDTRYLAGEAAPHAQAWSVITGAYAEVGRHELPATTPNWVSIDNRRIPRIALKPGDRTAYLHTVWNLTPDLTIFIDAVHRLSDLGAVVTHAAHGVTPEGFGAEWRMIELLTVEGDRLSRCEMFDEADLDAALARFDELSRATRPLENNATRIYSRFQAHFVERDFDAMAEMLTDDHCTDDRRPIVGAGPRNGRRDAMLDFRMAANEFGTMNIAAVVIATRGERLDLRRASYSSRDQRPGAFRTEVLHIVELDDDDDRIAAIITFDVDQIEAAFAELDARYLAGEATDCVRTWSVIARMYAGFNRGEFPAATKDWVCVDHRRVITIDNGDMPASIGAVTEQLPNLKIHIEAVHRLTERGGVIAHTAHGVSQEGFDAEWRMIFIYMTDGDLISRYELFDEADLDAALARFDELSRPVPRLENAASQVYERFWTCFAARDWAAMAEVLAAETTFDDDRRRVVNAGVHRGRDAAIADMRAVAELWNENLTTTLIAIRGERLALSRVAAPTTETEVLNLVEIDADSRIAALIAFDLGDIDAAFAALECRYAAVEAAAHADTWSVIAGAFAAHNRCEVPATTSDVVSIDHRRVAAFAPGQGIDYMRAGWDLDQHVEIYIEAVHQLSNLGAVFTWAGHGTAQTGFAAEWRGVNLVTADGEMVNRCEVFDEADLDAALARFDELSPRTPRLENAATRARARMVDAFNLRDVDAHVALMKADGLYEDRRKGLRDNGVARREVIQALFDAPKGWRQEIAPVAVRGSLLGVTRERFRDTADPDRPVTAENLTLTEVADDGLVSHTVLFDPDDIDGAMAELTARWIASGEVAHPDVIEAAHRSGQAYNHHDWDAIATIEAGAAYVNHRQLMSAEPETIVDHWQSIRTLASLIPDMRLEHAEIFAHSAIGLVSYVVVKGATAEGAAIELPTVVLVLFDGARVVRMEAFDVDQCDLALARFNELNTSSG